MDLSAHLPGRGAGYKLFTVLLVDLSECTLTSKSGKGKRDTLLCSLHNPWAFGPLDTRTKVARAENSFPSYLIIVSSMNHSCVILRQFAL